MNEFTDRIAAQRAVLQIVNRDRSRREELFGLSRNAIDRWTVRNGLDPRSRLVLLVETASAKLFFLANKSQQQISDEYKFLAREIAQVAEQLRSECN